MPKIIHIMDKLNVDGSSVHGVGMLLRYLLPEFDPERYHFQVYCLRDNAASVEVLCEQGLNVSSFRVSKFNFFVVFKILHLILTERPDILHLHGYGSWNFGRLAGFFSGRPVVLQEHMAHSLPPWYQRIADRVLSVLPCHGLAVSQNVKDFMVQQRYLRKEKIRVITNGVPVAAFRSPSDAKIEKLNQELHLQKGDMILGSIGRLAEEKGHRFVIEALPEVVASHPNVKFLLIGDGPLDRDLRDLAARLGVAEHVRFLGHRSDIDSLLGTMDVFIMPSLGESGSSLAVGEALAAGQPVLASACEGLKEMLEPTGAALFFRPGDTVDLVLQLRRMLADETLRKQFSVRAKNASEAYDIHRTSAQYAQLYEEIL